MQATFHTSMRMLRTYLGPRWRQTTLLGMLLLLSIALRLLGPQIIRQFIDQATQGANLWLLIMIAGLFIINALLDQSATLGTTYLSEKIGWESTNALRTDLAEHCLRLDMPFHNSRTPGELIERVDGDINALSVFFSQFVVNIFGSAILLLGVLVTLFLEDWRIGVALSLFVVLAFAVLLRLGNVAVPAIEREREASAQFFGFVEESLDGLDDLRANGAGSYVMQRFHRSAFDLFHTGWRAGMLSSTVWLSTMLLFALGHGIALGLGGYLFNLGAISLGAVYLCFQYTNMLRQPIDMLSQQLRELQRAVASIGRVQELYLSAPQILDGPGVAFPDAALSVRFEQVSFQYAELARPRSSGVANATEPVKSALQPGRSALSDIDFELGPGQVLGVLGRTGSGKTTLTRLLFRLYEPQHGRILLGGQPIEQARINELRNRIGIVTQDVQLFQASVRDNLTFFDPQVPDAQLAELLEDLGLGAWLRGLPHGLDSQLEGGSSGLSAGEAQLLAFARVFLKDPGLVILDEASSRLDPATELLIEHAVDRLLQGRTAIIIAHRLRTVQRADSILILEQGQIAEFGPRLQLLADPDSRFNAMLRTGLEEVMV